MHTHCNGKEDGSLAMPSDPKNTQMHLLYPALSLYQNKCYPINLVSCYLHIYLLTKTTAIKYVGYSFMCLPWAQK